MSTIEVRVTESVTAENFFEAVAKGDVQFYRVRGNGSTRHIPVFSEGSPEFQSAEWVQEQREDGRSMKDIAAELHLSVPSVRRLINSYSLSDEVAGYEAEDIEEILAMGNEDSTPEVGEVTGPAEDASEHYCTECGDALESGNVCPECAAKVFKA